MVQNRALFQSRGFLNHVKPSNYFGDKSVGFRGGDVRLVEGLPEVLAEEAEAGGDFVEGFVAAAFAGAEFAR